MLRGFLCLIGFQLIGELVREATHVPVPGPVIGLFALAILLAVRPNKKGHFPESDSLEKTAGGLLSLMGLFFVPAGVGLISEGDVLRRELVPIVAAVIGSTILSIVVTGVVMHWTMQSDDRHEDSGISESARSSGGKHGSCH